MPLEPLAALFVTVMVLDMALERSNVTFVSVPNAGLNCGNVRLPVQLVVVAATGVVVVKGPDVDCALAKTDAITASAVAARTRRTGPVGPSAATTDFLGNLFIQPR